MKKKILYIAYQFPPASGPAVHRNFNLANSLAEEGYQVVVVTRPVDEITGSSEKLDDSYEHSLSKNLEVMRLSTHEPIKLKNRLMRLKLFRLIWFFCYPFLWENAALWPWRNMRKLRQAMFDGQMDLIYTSSGPFTTMLMGYFIHRHTATKWVADLRDPFTDAYMWNFPSKLHWYIMRGFERWLFSKPDRLIVTTPEYKKLLERRKVKSTDRINVVTNGY